MQIQLSEAEISIMMEGVVRYGQQIEAETFLVHCMLAHYRKPA